MFNSVSDKSCNLFLCGHLLQVYCIPFMMSFFHDSSRSLQPCVSVCTFEEAVTFSRRYGLTLVSKNVTGRWGHIVVCCKSGSSDSRCQVQRCEAAQVQERHTWCLLCSDCRVHNINNCMIYHKCFRESIVAVKTTGVLRVTSGSRG